MTATMASEPWRELRFGGDSGEANERANWLRQPPRGRPFWVVYDRRTGEVSCGCPACLVGGRCAHSLAARFATAVEDATRALRARRLDDGALAALVPATDAEREAIARELAARRSLGDLAPLRRDDRPAARRELVRRANDDLFGECEPA